MELFNFDVLNYVIKYASSDTVFFFPVYNHWGIIQKINVIRQGFSE